VSTFFMCFLLKKQYKHDVIVTHLYELYGHVYLALHLFFYLYLWFRTLYFYGMSSAVSITWVDSTLW